MSLLLDRTRPETAFNQSGEGVEVIVPSLTNFVRPLRQILGDFIIMY